MHNSLTRALHYGPRRKNKDNNKQQHTYYIILYILLPSNTVSLSLSG